MHPNLDVYKGEIKLNDDIINNASNLLMDRGFSKTVNHSRRVAEEAKQLARHWDENETRAEIAGWLHDISAIIPVDHRLQVAEKFILEIITEERTAPILLHQKLSAVLAQDIFGITDKSILSAIGCHTTLKANCLVLDKIVFVADKIAWDQPGDTPYLTEMVSALDRSLDLAAYCYLAYLWQRKDSLPADIPGLFKHTISF